MAALRRGAAPHAPPRDRQLPTALLRLAAATGRTLAPFARDLLEFVLPQRCPACGVPAASTRLLCERCHALLPRLAAPVCARCLLEERAPDGCARHPHERVHAAWLYDERVALLVHALKFGGRPGLAAACAPAMAAALPADHGRRRIVTAVPLHAVRLRERGYDQAAALAAELARAAGAPYVPGLLERTRATRAQSSLGSHARRRNLAGAFRLREPAWVRGREVLVVDDVLTTGATLTAAMAALRSGGARTRGVVVAWAQ